MAASPSRFRNPLWVPLLMLSSLFPTSSSSHHHNILLPGEGFLNPTRASSCPAPDPDLNYRPVIGILSHPGDGASGRLNNGSGVTNIPASYVKFVESAGARVVPLIHTQPWEQIQEKLELVNGVLFTGGWAKVGLYFETAQKIFQIVLDKNDAGEHFPLFGICLGFEIISMIVTKDHDICERFSAADEASSLQFTNAADIQGSLFERFPPELLRKLSTECLAMQNHQFGLSPRRMHENDALSSFFKILTTTVDGNDQVYVSTAQAHNYPVTCFQWHPEKNAFEWGSSKIPHSEDAIQVTQNVANYFIREARKSSNRPDAQAVRDNLIYNYSPTYGGKAGKGYDEVYIFS
ncbi:gamma-glutamyl hydrolase 2-like [Iris pallida]|uniref:folate gamma-glutamyl hydrolase n=1 Tax=Iris pallida TaxID=29817 RepID=A0AAX6F694_IRIPA|nr:gamma-glutamyl hydrolase 2-like [Iris pallida]